MVLSTEFGVETTKNFLFHKHRGCSSSRYFLWVDLEQGTKTVQRPANLDKIEYETMDLEALLPMEVLSYANGWYSRRYEDTFRPTETETIREAIEAQLDLLQEAAADFTKMKSFIHSLDSEGEKELLSQQFCIGDLKQLDDGSYNWDRLPAKAN
jgi:hypothetical protein